MYVCNCNGFTERQIAQAVSEGPCSVAEVYRRLGDKPKCGKCVSCVVNAVRGARSTDIDAGSLLAFA